VNCTHYNSRSFNSYRIAYISPTRIVVSYDNLIITTCIITTINNKIVNLQQSSLSLYKSSSDLINLYYKKSYVEVNSLLYSVIEEIGKEKIQIDLTSNIGLSKMYIDMIMQKSISKLHTFPDEETLGLLCESLLHFFLTICTLPSERKIKINNFGTLDLVIPNLRNLKKYPDRSLIIQVIKNKNELNRIKQVDDLQPYENNIWIISASPFQQKYRNYTIYHGAKLYNFSDILLDIYSFLKDAGDRSFTFLPS
jgi:hypothetical protein